MASTSEEDLREPSAVVLATAGYDHTIRFWDVVRSECVGTLQHNESQVNCLALTRDKCVLAAGGNPAIRLYDTVAATRPDANANIPPIRVLEGHGNVMALGFTETHLWAASEEGVIRTWTLADYVCAGEFSAAPFIAGAAPHPLHSWLFIAGGSVAIWTLDGTCLYEEPSEATLRDISVSPDGNYSAILDHQGRLTLSRIVLLPHENDEGEQVVLDPLCAIQAHEGYGIKCLFSPDSRHILTTSSDGTARLFRIAIPEDALVPGSNLDDEGNLENSPPLAAELVLEKELIGHSKWIWDCAFSADSAYILTASSDNTARLWDVQSAETIAVYTGHAKAVTCLALNDLPTN